MYMYQKNYFNKQNLQIIFCYLLFYTVSVEWPDNQQKDGLPQPVFLLHVSRGGLYVRRMSKECQFIHHQDTRRR